VTRVAIVGTGKMARDLGAFYLGQGIEVVVAGSDRERLDAAFAALARQHRRLARAVPGAALPFPLRHLLGAGAPIAADVALECAAESDAGKRAICERAADLFAAAGAVATNSSSLLPADLWPGAVGAHHFYPAALTRIVEVVADPGSAPAAIAAVADLAAASGLAVFRADARRAFAANRLLLPVQNEAFRLLRTGAPAPLVDALSASPLCPLGQLALLDEIGIDVVRDSVARYLARMAPDAARALEELRLGLDELARAGKRGRKNGDGLLIGAPLPWTPAPASAPAESIRTGLEAALRDACRRALADGELDGGEIRLVLTRVYGADDGAIDASFPR
jgi:3-hydroxyacyl-CoA dehydrogenase/enoyl-CoA hydratase/3-hydroxybutyryl-CoA epimerase